MHHNRSFYKETGYKITDEPFGLQKYSNEITGLTEYYYTEAQYGSPNTVIRELLKLVKKYPDVPEFKNYLSIAYKRKGKNRATRKLLEETVQQHPTYLFGLSGLAEIYIEEKKYAQAVELMGGYPFDIKNIIKDREQYHYSEFLTFYAIAVIYELSQDNAKEAQRLHKMMYLLDPEHFATRVMAEKIITHRITTNLNRIKSSLEKAITVKSFPTVQYEKRSEPPVFKHEAIHALYQNPSDNLPLEVQEKLLALPRESLIQDLEKVIKDSIYRFDYFYKTYTEWNEAEQSFTVHALYLLAHLEAKDSLPVVLDMMRQGEKFLDYWFSDSFEGFFEIPVFILGKNQLEVLQQYVLESNQSSQARYTAARAVVQVAWHYPERKAEVLNWFRTVIQHLLNNPEDKTIFDTDFIGLIVVDLMYARLVELEPEIVALYEKGWISEIHAGELPKILERLHMEADPYDRLELPQNLNEFYTEEYLELTPSKEVQTLLNDDPYQNYLSSSFFAKMPITEEEEEDEDYFDDYEFVEPEPVKPVEPFKREGKKVGRNDPCPCGSGKKHKKCCGKP